MTRDDLVFEEMTHELQKFATKNGLDFSHSTNVDTRIFMLRFYNPQTRQGYMQGITYDDLMYGNTQILRKTIIECVKKELLDETAEKVNSIS